MSAKDLYVKQASGPATMCDCSSETDPRVLLIDKQLMDKVGSRLEGTVCGP